MIWWTQMKFKHFYIYEIPQMTELESIDTCRPGWHHELWLIDSHLLLIGPGLWTMSIVLSVKWNHLCNIPSDEHYKFETVSWYPYKTDSKCSQKLPFQCIRFTLILFYPYPNYREPIFTIPYFTLIIWTIISSNRISSLFKLDPYFTLINNLSQSEFYPTAISFFDPNILLDCCQS